jgi:hypothetical protein
MSRLYFATLGVLLASCSLVTQKKEAVESPKGYDFSQPTTIRLPETLDEISGMVYDSRTASIIALNDEEGRIYEIPIDGSRKFPSKKFAKGGDFEDLCWSGQSLWALKSNGQLSRIPYPLTDTLRAENFAFSGRGPVDFETLIPLAGDSLLVLLCKECRNYPGVVPGFLFNINTGQCADSPAFRLDFSQLPEKEQDKIGTGTRPSAAAFHPRTGELFILASANHRLFIADANGRVTQSIKLDKAVFKQPEGICFDERGNLFVSNEARTGSANIRRFAYQDTP